MTEEELTTLLETGKLKVLDYEVTSEEVAVSYCTSGLSAAGDHFETHANSQVSVFCIASLTLPALISSSDRLDF